jgi:hypothetical protein
LNRKELSRKEEDIITVEDSSFLTVYEPKLKVSMTPVQGVLLSLYKAATICLVSLHGYAINHFTLKCLSDTLDWMVNIGSTPLTLLCLYTCAYCVTCC